MIEHIGEMPGALWRELVDGEEDPFDVGESDIEWRGKTHHTAPPRRRAPGGVGRAGRGRRGGRR